MERHKDFYDELRQINAEFQGFVEQCYKMSPFFDFSPTYEDYISKVRDLKEKFPLLNNSSICPPTLMSIQPNSENKPPLSTKTLSIGSNVSSLTISTSTIASGKLFDLSSAETLPNDLTSNRGPGEEPAGGRQSSGGEQRASERIDLNNLRHSARCKLYERATKRLSSSDLTVNFLGVGYIYVRGLEEGNESQVIFMEESGSKRVLLNETVTSSVSLKLYPKAVEIEFPRVSDLVEVGKANSFIIKLADQNEARILFDVLSSHMTDAT